MSTTVVTKVGTKNADQVVLLDAAGDQVTSFGGGTQYTEGDTDASITGTAALMEVGSNTLQPVQGTVADGLLVNLGSNNDVTVASLPLPALASTSTKQSDGSQKTQVVDGSGNVIAATSNALNVHIASGSSSGTQYTEGDTDASITGTALLWEDTGDTLRAVSAAKPLPVSFTGGGDASAANQTTIIGHVDGIETILGTIDTDTGGIATSTASIDTKTPALGQALAAASVPVVLTAAQITTLTPVSTVTVTGVSTLAEQQTQTTALQLIDDTVATLGTTTYTETTTKGIIIGAVRRDADTTLANTTNEITPLQVDENGYLKVEIFDGGGSHTVDYATTGSGTATGALRVELPTNGTGTLATVSTVTTVSTLTGGAIAHDGADSGNPLKIGARATNVEIAAVANNDRSDLVTTLTGKLITQPYSNPENFVSGAITSAMTGTTSTSLVAAPASGLRNYITTIICSNSHATVGTDIVIQDGSGGTTLLTIPAAAVYGGSVITLPTPLRQPTTATALYCANVTTGASTKVSAVGYKAA